MNRERLVWLAVVLIAIGWGAVRGGKGDDRAGGEAAAEDSRQKRSGGSRGQRGDDPFSDARVPRDQDGLRKFANHALSTPSRTERFKRVMSMLDEVTPENWRTIWTEYIRQTLKEGRVHEEEWSLFMNRVGEIAGPDAMEYFSNHAQNQYTFNRREVLQGWAASDPQGAHRWLTGQPADKQPIEFWQAVLNGSTAKDPKIALGWLQDAPPQFADRLIRGNVTSQIQADGLEGTIKSLEKMVAENPEGTEPPPYLKTFYKELDNRVKRMKWLAEAYPDIDSAQPQLDRLAVIFGKDEAPPHPPIIQTPPSQGGGAPR